MNPLRQFRRSVTAAALGLLAAGLALVEGPLAHAVVAQVSAAQARATWEKWKQAHPGSPAGLSSAPGDPVFWLRVPSCKISTLVAQESDAEALHSYPGVRQLDSGGCVVFAHRDMHFRPLADVRVGDEISVESADGHLTSYTVRMIRVLLPEQVSAAVEDPGSRGAVHLLTCYPFRYVGAAPKRFLVTATRRS